MPLALGNMTLPLTDIFIDSLSICSGRGAETTVRVLKNRYSGELGIACHLKYDLQTCQFHETAIETEPEFDATTDF